LHARAAAKGERGPLAEENSGLAIAEAKPGNQARELELQLTENGSPIDCIEGVLKVHFEYRDLGVIGGGIQRQANCLNSRLGATPHPDADLTQRKEEVPPPFPHLGTNCPGDEAPQGFPNRNRADAPVFLPEGGTGATATHGAMSAGAPRMLHTWVRGLERRLSASPVGIEKASCR